MGWLLQATCPAGWDVHLERCGGGFFHSPAGLAAGAPPGEALYALARVGDRVVGIAAGVRARCQLGRARHLYFPTLPAVADAGVAEQALGSLAATLREEGNVAEVAFDSFDACWTAGPVVTTTRHEHVVDLRRSPEERLRQLTPHHRRLVHRGGREAWTFRELAGEAARRLLWQVQRWAAARAAGRGDPFDADVPPPTIEGEWDRPWGTTMFGVWCRDTPLAAALVGWANRRAFYVSGGSTPEGYAGGAAVWLHWSIMARLAEAGFTGYNLGGTPAGAMQAGHPANGLYRFKRSFGADDVPCAGARWRFQRGHLWVHDVIGWVRRVATLRRAG